MILEPGPPGVASFIDETSADSRKTGGHKISIHGQVVPEKRIDWFFEVIHLVTTFMNKTADELHDRLVGTPLASQVPDCGTVHVTSTGDARLDGHIGRS